MVNETEKQLDVASEAIGPNLLSWDAPEFEHREKSLGWQVLVWLGAISLAILAIVFLKLTFTGIVSAIAALSGALALTTQGRLKPQIVHATINDEGVTIKGQLYEWKDLKGFWIVFSEQSQMLYIETNRRLLSIISVQLGKTDPEQVRGALTKHIPEQADRAEDFSDKLARMIKF